ncbi:hypothetical protein Lalb_Chr13g0299951 [Lupinus albus]|uniref:Uncharacterized protein n=1 Tax=Lupinus albus TaxID=3870 RepID=A0A6A4PJF6_LUPAL|nr:hypothetical protein Lalb_Chr13g0299951 [Lupinus albus]
MLHKHKSVTALSPNICMSGRNLKVDLVFFYIARWQVFYGIDCLVSFMSHGFAPIDLHSFLLTKFRGFGTRREKMPKFYINTLFLLCISLEMNNRYSCPLFYIPICLECYTLSPTLFEYVLTLSGVS